MQSRIETTIVIDGCRCRLPEPRPEHVTLGRTQATGGRGSRRTKLQDFAQAENVLDLVWCRRPRLADHDGYRVGDERSAIPTALADQVAGLGEFADGLANRVPADQEARGQIAFRRQRLSGRDDAETNGLQQARDRVLERVSVSHRTKQRLVDDVRQRFRGRGSHGCYPITVG